MSYSFTKIEGKIKQTPEITIIKTRWLNDPEGL